MNSESKRLRELLDLQALRDRLRKASKDYMLWSRLLAIAEDTHANDKSLGQDQPTRDAVSELQAICDDIRSGDISAARSRLQALREDGVDLRLGCDVESEAANG